MGGNSFTTLLATLNPSELYYEECFNTLQFANRCMFVENKPRVNFVETEELLTEE
jgi:hypothetical protein